MKKIKKSLKAIGAILQNPWLLNLVLADDKIWGKYLSKKNYPEKGLPVTELDTLFPEFSEVLNTFTFLDGGSLPTDIALLKLLAKKYSDCQYFEIGTWRGESVANVADVASRCFTLNLSKKEMLEKGMDEKSADLHGFFSKGRENITHLEGNSLTFDFAGFNRKFDLIFIDGDHHYDIVKKDTENVFAHLVHDKSIVVWHDYAYHPEKMRPEVFAAIMDGTPADKRKYLVHAANTICAVFIPETLKTHPLETPVKPRKRFKISIESQKL